MLYTKARGTRRLVGTAGRRTQHRNFAAKVFAVLIDQATMKNRGTAPLV